MGGGVIRWGYEISCVLGRERVCMGVRQLIAKYNRHLLSLGSGDLRVKLTTHFPLVSEFTLCGVVFLVHKIKMAC